MVIWRLFKAGIACFKHGEGEGIRAHELMGGSRTKMRDRDPENCYILSTWGFNFFLDGWVNSLLPRLYASDTRQGPVGNTFEKETYIQAQEQACTHTFSLG